MPCVSIGLEHPWINVQSCQLMYLREVFVCPYMEMGVSYDNYYLLTHAPLI